MKDKIQIQSEWTVARTLQERPEISHIFIKHRTQCVGCLVQRFCTIKDAAEIYEMDLNNFLQDLNQSTFESSA